MIRSILFIFLLASAATVQAQIYKCVDAKGKVVYSQDRCPANVKSAPITRAVPAAPIVPAAPTPVGDPAKNNVGKADAAKASAPKTPAEQEQAFRKRQQEQQEAEKKETEKVAQAKDKEENCRRAREQMAQIEAGGRIARFNEKGERYFLDDSQMNQEKSRANSLADQWCK